MNSLSGFDALLRFGGRELRQNQTVNCEVRETRHGSARHPLAGGWRARAEASRYLPSSATVSRVTFSSVMPQASSSSCGS